MRFHKGHTDWRSLPVLVPGGDEGLELEDEGGLEEEDGEGGRCCGLG